MKTFKEGQKVTVYIQREGQPVVSFRGTAAEVGNKFVRVVGDEFNEWFAISAKRVWIF